MDTKRCCNCKQTKPRSEFHRNQSAPDGKQSWCMECKSTYQTDNPEANRRHQTQFNQRSPEQGAARKIVKAAIKNGTLIPGPCEDYGMDCAGNIEAHHPDYNRPLDVNWLCKKHHHERHTVMRATKAPQPSLSVAMMGV